MRTGVGGRLFDPVHVPASGEEIVCEFDDEYFYAVLQSVHSLAGASQLRCINR
jgi:hypothetical protein